MITSDLSHLRQAPRAFEDSTTVLQQPWARSELSLEATSSQSSKPMRQTPPVLVKTHSSFPAHFASSAHSWQSSACLTSVRTPSPTRTSGSTSFWRSTDMIGPPWVQKSIKCTVRQSRTENVLLYIVYYVSMGGHHHSNVWGDWKTSSMMYDLSMT